MQSPAKRRVLVVDDEERVTRILDAILRDEYSVQVCNDPIEALKLVRSTFFHVVISDQRMPQMDGSEFLRRAKEISAASIRILLTGYSDLHAIVDSLNEGEIFRFVRKPWRTDEIRDIVREAAEISAQTVDAIRSARISRPGPLESSRDFQDLGDVLVLDGDAEILRMIGNQQPEFVVHHATSVARALDILAEFRIAIVVSEMFVGGESSARLLRLLKLEYPHILIILASSALDSEGATQLINYVQVFRFVPKPVRPGLLRQNIRSAYSRYKEFSRVPQLAKRHVVARSESVPASESALWRRVRQFVGTLRLARDRAQ
jgi:DNA-binding NtrC family response regulator